MSFDTKTSITEEKEVFIVKPVAVKKKRYVKIAESIFEALSPLSYAVYTALRFESDFTKECSDVKKNRQFLANRSKISVKQVGRCLNELESFGLMVRENNPGHQSIYWVAEELGYLTKNLQGGTVSPGGGTVSPDPGTVSPDIYKNSFSNSFTESKDLKNAREPINKSDTFYPDTYFMGDAPLPPVKPIQSKAPKKKYSGGSKSKGITVSAVDHVLVTYGTHLPKGMDSALRCVENLGHVVTEDDILNAYAWWDMYPVKQNIKGWLLAWFDAGCHKMASDLILTLQDQIKNCQRLGGGFAPSPMNYISGERWNDEAVKPKKSHYDHTDTSWINKKDIFDD